MTAQVCAPRICTPVTITEMHYARDLLMRADTAIAREFEVLRAAGVEIDWTASQGLSVRLMGMAIMLHTLALEATETRRAAGPDLARAA
ncbi:MAG TPA: hypothetical protein VF800_11745 [Telluria sp.]|jgi:hypothetical protein